MDLEIIACGEVDDVLRQLPAEIRREAIGIPVAFDGRPSEELKERTVDVDTLGLLVGGNRNEEAEGLISMPVQIFLFLENLWDESEGNLLAFKNEIRVTYLHELGHYLGLEEEDLEFRGLA